MKPFLLRTRSLAYLLLLLTGLGALPLRADQVDVNVETAIKPSKVVGLLLSRRGLLEVEPKKVISVQDGLIVVSIEVDKKKMPEDTMASAMILSESGELAFGNVRLATGLDDATSIFKMATCPAEELSSGIAKEQYGVFETLVQYRTARRDIEKLKTTRSLKPEFINELKKLERGFGLTSETPLSADLPPADLVDRLARIESALKSYTAQIKRRK